MSEARRMAALNSAELHLLAPAGYMQAQALAAKLKMPLNES